jgi:intergrase/recombinase
MPSDANAMRKKGNVVLYLDKDLVEKSKSLGFNLSKTFENHLKHLMTQFSTVNSLNNPESQAKRMLKMGLPGFEPGSIEPKAPKSIDWSKYKEYLLSKYARSYALQLFEYSRKYFPLVNDVNSILLAKSTIRNNVINALTALSRFLGNYNSFMAEMKAHGIKRVRADPVQAFTRIFNSNAHNGLGEWYQAASAVLKENERLYLRFMLLSGVRAMEGVKAFNLIVQLSSKYKEEYYNKNTGFLEHFKYPELFLRRSKNAYVTAVPRELLDNISTSSKIAYNAIDKRLDRAGMPMRIKRLRSYYATKIREMGLLSEQIDLVQGRVGKSIFLQHYFKQDAKLLSNRILQLLPKLEETLLS